MKFEHFLTKTKDFLIKRVTELIALVFMFLSISILISLLSYSPSDPNFVVENTNEIQNIFGYRGSVTSDFLFQSVGLVAYLIPFTLFFSSLNMLIYKRQVVLIDSLFFCILYIIFGSLFFSYFKNQSFLLIINGNGGFVGTFFKGTFLTSILEINENVSFYFLIVLNFFIFLVSTKLKLSQIINFYNYLKKLFRFKKDTINNEEVSLNKEVTYSNNTESSRVQDILPFDKKTETNNKKFTLPDLKLLKSPSKNEKVAKNNEDIDEDFLEKVLMDFGVEGKIKKIIMGQSVH
jgi:hypothetical protein